jgi:hypothetical protein
MQSENQSDSRTESASSGAGYSREQLQEAVSAYYAHFDDAVPLGLITTAASAFRSRELMVRLLDRVRANDPVESWSEFYSDFLESRIQLNAD